MKPFESYRHIGVSGEAISCVAAGVSATALAKTLLARYGLGSIEPGKHYPMDSYLHLLFDIDARMPVVLKNVGQAIIEVAQFPPIVTSFELALQSTDIAYYMNHTGVQPGEIGHYHFEKEPSGDLVMTVDTPYPCRFDEGISWGMARRFEQAITIAHDGDQCRNNGDSTCIYRIKMRG